MYSRFFGLFTYITSVVVFLFRYHWGMAFAQAGSGKLANLEGTADFFRSIGIAYPELNAWFVGSLEYWGGLALVWGFATRLAAFPLAITMITAYITAHFNAVQAALPGLSLTGLTISGFNPLNWSLGDPSQWTLGNPRNWSLGPIAEEHAFMFLVTTLLVLMVGPGKISIDAVLKGLLGKRKSD